MARLQLALGVLCLMSVASAFVIWAAINVPHCVDPAYLKFLYRHWQLGKVTVMSMKNMQLRLAAGKRRNVKRARRPQALTNASSPVTNWHRTQTYSYSYVEYSYKHD